MKNKKNNAKFLLFYKFYSIIQTPSKINKNEKFIIENSPTYLSVPFGSLFTYSLSVIRLAREDINVPTPPIFTPRSKSL